MRALARPQLSPQPRAYGLRPFSASSVAASAAAALARAQSQQSPSAAAHHANQRAPLAQLHHPRMTGLPSFIVACHRCLSHAAVLNGKRSKLRRAVLRLAERKRMPADGPHELEGKEDYDDDDDDDDNNNDNNKHNGDDDDKYDHEAELNLAASKLRGYGRDKAMGLAAGNDFDPTVAFGLGDVDAEYGSIDVYFEKRLQELKTGGRFHPDSLGRLPVRPDRASQQAYPLRELAQVVQRGGRTVSILVSDASYIKPIMSAVQNCPAFNQQPQRDLDNDLELILKIEPENPDQQQRRLKSECNVWRNSVRNVLSARKIKHNEWMRLRHISKDDAKNLANKVKARQDKKIDEIDRREKILLRQLANTKQRL